MALNHRQVEAFRAVMLVGSMTSAAQMLGISQPAVSRLIRDLEASVGLRLFQREGNRLLPAPEAMVLFKEVDLHYRGLAQIENVVRDMRGPSRGSMRIAATGSLSQTFLPDIAAEYLRGRPGLDIEISTMISTQIVERVSIRHYDLGLVQVMMADYPNLRVTPLPALPAVCILPRGHRLARHDEIEAEMLAGEAFVSLGRNSPLRLRTDALFNDRGIKRQIRLEATLALSVRQLVSRGLGIGIIDPLVANHMPDEAVVVRPFVPTIAFEVAAVLPDHATPPPRVREFVALIRTRLRERVEG